MHNKTVVILKKSNNDQIYESLRLEEARIMIHTMRDNIEAMPLKECSVLVLDCGVDIKNGLCALKNLKAVRPDLPVVFIADSTSDNTAVDALRLGAREYFKKPVRINELKDIIEKLICLKDASKEKRTPLRNNIQLKIRETFIQFSSALPENIFQSVCYIEDELLSEEINIKNINLDALAKRANLSKYHFIRVFKKNTGMSPMQFIIYMKINKAKELLRRDDYKVSRVAMDVGFQDISNFIKQFKKVTGFTPTDYKGSLLNNL